ncbi:MAG: hypothetical protein Q9195_002858 [Heterodermia aff. obscurata]
MEASNQHFQVRNAKVGQQDLKDIAMRVAGNGLDFKEGAFNVPKPHLKVDDGGVRPQGSPEVAMRARDSDPEYEPGVVEDDDSGQELTSSKAEEYARRKVVLADPLAELEILIEHGSK